MWIPTEYIRAGWTLLALVFYITFCWQLGSAFGWRDRRYWIIIVCIALGNFATGQSVN